MARISIGFSLENKLLSLYQLGIVDIQGFVGKCIYRDRDVGAKREAKDKILKLKSSATYMWLFKKKKKIGG